MVGEGEEENVALVAKAKKKAKKRYFSGEGEAKDEGERHEKSVRLCLWEMGHYVVQCPNKKRKKKYGATTSIEVDKFDSIFDTNFALSAEADEFALEVSLATHVTSSHAWFVDSRATCHMTGVRDHFISLLKDDIDLEVVFGDNSKLILARVRKISFQRESLPPLKVTNVLHVPGLKKNLISVSNLEERGYEVVFCRGQVLIYPKGSNVEHARVIGLWSGRLYRFMF